MTDRGLETVISDWRERASHCRRVKDDRVANVIDDICNDVAEATEDYRHWLSEGDAMIRSGKGRYWLRARFGGLGAQRFGALESQELTGAGVSRDCGSPTHRHRTAANGRQAGRAW